ncbi:hypothetical protein IJ21_39340 [Paenibacillus sp. 32O-W]|nr:hypothetical protein IJ21_39340 [Paenibacillus sp. 32O-W]
MLGRGRNRQSGRGVSPARPCQGQRTIPLAWPRTKSPARPWSFVRSAVPRTADDPARLAADEIASQGVEFRPLGRDADSGRSRPPAVRVLIGRQRRPAYAPSHRCRPLRHTALDVHDFEPGKLLEYPLAHHADEMGHQHSGTILEQPLAGIVIVRERLALRGGSYRTAPPGFPPRCRRRRRADRSVRARSSRRRRHPAAAGAPIRHPSSSFSDT